MFLKNLNFGIKKSFYPSLLKYNFSSAAVSPKLNIVKQEYEKPRLKIKTDLSSDITELKYFPHKDIPLITIKQSSFKKRKPLTEPSIKVTEIRHSAYKLNDVCRTIRRKYIHEALEILETQQTKAAKIIKESLENYMKSKEKKKERQNEIDKKKFESENPEEEFVPKGDYYRIVEAYVGKKKGMKMPVPRAKGRTDLIVRNISHLFMHIEKIDESEFLQNAAVGKADITFAYQLRKNLFTSGASLQKIKSYSFITTARGRYYRRHQISRLISHLRRKYYKEKGILLSADIISNYLKVNLGRALTQMKLSNFSILSNTPNLSEFDKLKIKAYKKLEDAIKPKTVKQTRDYEDREELFTKQFNKI